MKNLHRLVCLTLFVFTVTSYAGEDFPFPIYQRVSGYEITNTWFVAKSRIEKASGWDEKGEPSLPVGKAISLAKDWVISKGGRTNSYVTTVEFRSADRGAPPSSSSKFRHFWFYIIQFHEVAQYGSSMTCIVLVDGSIVEPESTITGKGIGRYLD